MQSTPGQPLSPEMLCHRSDPDDVSFESTDDLDDLTEVPGQERALEAMHFAAGISVDGHNVYVLGRPGSGRHELVRRFLEKKAAESPVPDDWCYVYNFDDPREPAPLSLPPGRGREFKEDIGRAIADAQSGIPAAFESDEFQVQREAITESFREAQESVFREVEAEAGQQGLAVVQTPTGIAFVPVRDGETLSPEEFSHLPEADQKRFHESIAAMTKRLQNAMRSMPKKASEMRRQVQELEREVAGLAVSELLEELKEKYRDLPAVTGHLERMRRDIVENVPLFLPPAEASQPAPQAVRPEPDESRPMRRYDVNVLVNRTGAQGAPVVFVEKPTFQDLIGRIEHQTEFGSLVTHFNLIRPGSLHRANGGYLVLDAEKLLAYPQAWDGLKTALKSREIRIRSLGDEAGMVSTVTLDPKPVPLDVKVILVGERRYYYMLQEHDPEFSELFKVPADFEDEMVRSHANVEELSRWLATTIRTEGLKHLDRQAVARLMDEISRQSGDRERLSSNIGFALDIVREAHYWAGQNEKHLIGGDEIQLAVDARVRRGSRVRDRMQEELIRETFLVETDGEQLGQINGLAVMQVGGLAFGRPQRITATVALGSGRVIDIEREVKLGGPLHSKGVLILSGFLRSRYSTDRPLSLSASLVFEQSYGGVDGDSASAAELCVLASALSEAPLKQTMAITGSVDQQGRVQAIGGVNEKIEGFFDICRRRGLTGDQAVLIPRANVKHLMLRRDVVEAVESEQFNVYAIDHVDQALEILTGLPAGSRGEDGRFTEGSVNRKVQDRLELLADARRSFGGREDRDGERS